MWPISCFVAIEKPLQGLYTCITGLFPGKASKNANIGKYYWFDARLQIFWEWHVECFCMNCPEPGDEKELKGNLK